MNRIEILRTYLDEVLLNMSNLDHRRWAFLHLYGVAQACALLALKRGQNAELATMAGMLHDIYSYTNNTTNHAHQGAILAKDILNRLQITNEEETEAICKAIYHHSDKATKYSDFKKY